MTIRYVYENYGDDKKLRELTGEEFDYYIEDEDIKYDIVKNIIDRKQLINVNPYDVIDVMDELYCFDSILEDEDTIDYYKRKYEPEAFDWFESEQMEA